ncbi:MAG: DUF1549 domain-containing protein [Acidobacteria bacterium]|nr:DUF1549 domain-containing protein [Acidobacteriota bacterium]
MTKSVFALAVHGFIFGIAAMVSSPAAWAQVDYQRDVHPVLAAKCFACHGGDKRSGGLSLRDYQSVLDGGRSGAVVVPGEGGESLLVRRVSGEIKPVMPPAGAPLSEHEVAVLRAWIDQGARSAPTAAAAKRRFVAPLELTKPAATFDELLDAYLKKNGVTAAPVADAVFARRVYLDLWGFLPSPEQLREFTSDKGADKRGRLVRQLLAHRENTSEHWLSYWNDLLRNEDRFGTYGGDRLSISPWLKQALTDNMPFDRMLRTLLNPREKTDPEGFIRGVNWRGEANASQMPWIQAAQNTAQVFLGINLKCNSCHDSFISKWKLKQAYGLAAYFSPDPKLELVRCDAATGEHTTAHFLYPQLDRPAGETLNERRAAAADIFTDPRNGRTPRTMVNRIWAKLLGRGIVEPVDDMDQEPWSPEILDRLTSDFVEHGYDLQWLISTIISSKAYQLPSVAQPDSVFRGPSIRRVTAEQFIDSISAITGEWPVLQLNNSREARYVREARLASSPLSRALGRPFRDQVITERATEATTLQALELVNGKDLYQLVYRGARRMLGQLQPSPKPLFDSLVMRGDTKPVAIDLPVAGLKQLYLVVADAGSYATDMVKTNWTTDAFGVIDTGAVSTKVVELSGKNLDRFKASVRVDPSVHRSDINPSVRFFVFAEKPNYDQLVPVAEQRPAPLAETTKAQLAKRVFQHAMGRDPLPRELRLLRTETPEELADVLWALSMTPEFQLIP